MKKVDAGTIVAIDKLGRIVIPTGLRQMFDIQSGDKLLVSCNIVDGQIIITPYAGKDALCAQLAALSSALDGITFYSKESKAEAAEHMDAIRQIVKNGFVAKAKADAEADLSPHPGRVVFNPHHGEGKIMDWPEDGKLTVFYSDGDVRTYLYPAAVEKGTISFSPIEDK